MYLQVSIHLSYKIIIIIIIKWKVFVLIKAALEKNDYLKVFNIDN